MSALDAIILIPVIPLIPLAVVWYLPWEHWVWKRLSSRSRKFVGPYLMYVSFVFWHFRLHWWAVLCVFATGVAISAWSIRQLLEARKK
jgi:hypothetical protein